MHRGLLILRDPSSFVCGESVMNSRGYILLARKLLKSEIMGKPPLYMKLWVWILLRANHRDWNGIRRGQLFTTIDEMRRAMSYKVGYRTETPTEDQIRSAYEAWTKTGMIITTKTTRGMIITICNYNEYQSPENYEAHSETRTEDSMKTGEAPHYIQECKEIRNKRNTPETLSSLKARYPTPELVDQAFKTIASTRRTGKVAESVLIKTLDQCSRYPVEQVEAGVRIYLEKDYASQGKDEKYLLGIIRNLNGGQDQERVVTATLVSPPAHIRDGFDMDDPIQFQQYLTTREAENDERRTSAKG